MLYELGEALRNKAISFVGAGYLVVSGEATKAELLKSEFIDLAHHGVLNVSYTSWMQIIGSVWILILILEKLGLFKLISYLFKKAKGE